MLQIISHNFQYQTCSYYACFSFSSSFFRGGRVVRRCWVNFQCRGVLLIWSTVGQGLTALAVGAGGGCLDGFSLVYHFSFLSPFLWETARYRLKYCLKGPLNPKQPTNHHPFSISKKNFKRKQFLLICDDWLCDIQICQVGLSVPWLSSDQF